MGTIRSLAYFLPVIDEVLESRVSPDYFDYVGIELNAEHARTARHASFLIASFAVCRLSRMPRLADSCFAYSER